MSAGGSTDKFSRILSLIAIAISLGSLYYAHRNLENAERGTRTSYAGIRPIVNVNLLESSFDSKEIKLVFALENSGKTTAKIESLQIIVGPQNEDGCGHGVTCFQNVILAPGKSLLDRVFVHRPSAMGNAVVDPLQSINENGKLPVTVKFCCKELPENVHDEPCDFHDIQWHDKSIIGVGR